MLAQEKKLLIDLMNSLPDKRHRNVVQVEKRHQNTKKCSGEMLEVRIVGDARLIHKIEHIAIETGAMTVEESSVSSIPAEQVEREFSDNPAGVVLQGVRYREGMTQNELCCCTGIPQRHISEMENGKRSIGKVNAKKLAKALDVDYRIFL